MTAPRKPSADRLIKSGLEGEPRAPDARPHFSGKLIFFPGWCKRCGLCTVICPHQALSLQPDGTPELSNPDACRMCSLCWRICPDFAIVPNIDRESDDAPE